MFSLFRVTRAICVSLILVVLAVGMAACSLSFGSSGPTSVSKQISAAQGGTLTVSTGATLTIPANALTTDATVTLADLGKPKHANGDPLEYVSDMFSASATAAPGAKVSLKSAALLSITPDSNAIQNAQDLIVAEVDPNLRGAIRLHYANPPSSASQAALDSAANTAQVAAPAASAFSPRAPTVPPPGGSIAYNYNMLNSTMWAVGVPVLKQIPAEHEVLQVPWYYQSGLPWCVPTSLSAMLRYYDFQPSVGDPLVNTLGGSKALANWQIAAKNNQSANDGASYNELKAIGLPSIDDSSGTGYLEYLWDDNFFVSLDGAHGNFTDFETYVALVNTGLFGLFERKPLMLAVEQWVHSVVIVGVDGNSLYLHDSNGPIAEKLTWDDFQKQAKGWYTDAQGQQKERHSLVTAVLYGYPIRAEKQRRGSIVIARNDISTKNTIGGKLGVEWDGQSPHTYGYYLNNLDNTSWGTNTNTLGYLALRSIPLSYRYRIANVTNVPLTFNAVAELSGPNYGDNLVASQVQSVTVPPYSESGYITGSLNEPASGDIAIFDVKLFETGSTSVVQDVKFVRYKLHDATKPTVQITQPANGSHVFAGANVVFTSTSVDPDSNHSLPASYLFWTVDGSYAGVGGFLTHIFTSTGTHTITLKGTNAAGKSGSASISITVDPAPPAAYVKIVSPTNGSHFPVDYTATSWSVTLIGSGSPGMQYSWSSSIDGSLGSGATITRQLTIKYSGMCAQSTAHVITLNGTDNLGRSASASITIYLTPTCIK